MVTDQEVNQQQIVLAILKEESGSAGKGGIIENVGPGSTEIFFGSYHGLVRLSIVFLSLYMFVG